MEPYSAVKPKRKKKKFKRRKGNNPNVEASLIATKEGLPITSALPQGCNKNRIAAMSATFIAISKGFVTEMGVGDLKRFVIEGTEGNIITVEGSKFNGTAITTKKADLDRIFLDLHKTVLEFEGLLDQ
ncbi:MAG: roadblock/LC7 domain-containing protein [Promethearchaeota archaeon]|jgi:predicted regulator of Ras-like GTPase activity (Roadblock/LC7/MglB family)